MIEALIAATVAGGVGYFIGSTRERAKEYGWPDWVYGLKRIFRKKEVIPPKSGLLTSAMITKEALEILGKTSMFSTSGEPGKTINIRIPTQYVGRKEP